MARPVAKSGRAPVIGTVERTPGTFTPVVVPNKNVALVMSGVGETSGAY